jgi:GTP-binding protein EngB required for normal cell division
MSFINPKTIAYRHKIDEVVKDLHELTVEIKHEDLARTVSDLRARIYEPFMFVIVGEVKAGKSSFINALLDADGKEVCKVSPAPMTDTIQQIMYGEEEAVITINPFLKKVTMPVEILKEIAIVDTPGTNTIVANHQTITEQFIPACDLTVFVFEAKNPYRQSAWEFFDFIHAEWRRKVIFILQQKDLMPADDLTINMNGVREHALTKGVTNPQIFAVSAKMELDGKYDESGFSNVRDYIKTHITGGKASALKLKNNVDTCLNINERIKNGLNLRNKQWALDMDFRGEVRQTLDKQEQRSNNQVATLVENILANYDKIARHTEEELRGGLSFPSMLKRSFSSVFNKSASSEVWFADLSKNLETRMNNELRNKLNDGVIELADSIRQMATMIDLKVQNNRMVLDGSQENIFEEITQRRGLIIKDLQESFSRFMSRSENFTDEALFANQKSMSPNVATGSGLAVIGMILAALTKSVIFDVTGGILTTVGLIFAGASATFQRSKVLNSFSQEIKKGRDQLENELKEKLGLYIKNIKQRINTNFTNFDTLLVQEEGQIKVLSNKQSTLNNRLENMKKELEVG